MRRQRTALLAAALLVLVAGLPGGAEGQQASQLRGTWVLDRERSDDVNAQIVEATRGMNAIVGPVARRRLRATNTAYPRIAVSFDEQTVRVEMHDRPAASSPASGQPVLWERTSGRTCPRVSEDCVQLTTEWQNGRLVQTFRPEDGERRNVLSVSPDGNTLTMSVTIRSPRLRRDLTYDLVFNRAS
jgi:hypothetical protein